MPSCQNTPSACDRGSFASRVLPVLSALSALALPLATVASVQAERLEIPTTPPVRDLQLVNRDSYQIVNTYPHDPKAFCQGLTFADGFLYEGTGRYGQSSLRKVDLRSGRVLQAVRLNPRLFGEGIAIHGGEIIQLTWRSRTALVFDKQTFKYLRSFRYAGEGWGLTDQGQHLILSDGSSTLRFIDPGNFRVVKQLAVRDRGRRLDYLNELEFVEGEIYANVWGADYIARISPSTGKVLGWIDLTGLYPAHLRSSPEAVLNGIAYDRQGKRLFVTGKFWPKLFEIRLVPKR